MTASESSERETSGPEVIGPETSQPKTSKKPPPDLGVLFVHGVGQQSRGATLVQFGDPFVRWMQQWFRKGAELEKEDYAKATGKKPDQLTEEERAKLNWNSINVSKARVKCEEDTPANAEIEISLFRHGIKCETHWLIAESCWANTFVAPTFAALAFWGLVVYPWTNAVHFGARMRRRWRRAKDSRSALAIGRTVLVTAASFVGSVVVSIIVVAVLSLLLILAIPPIPSLRAMLLRIQQRLADSLGDSFILAASPIQKAAIVSHVRRDLEWLIGQGCQKIAVVAHSQGAAVAFETLTTGVVKGRESGNTLLITFGSGLGKLYEVERAISSDRARLGWMPIIGLALIVAALEFFNLIDLVPFLGGSIGFGLFCAFFGTVFWIGGVTYSSSGTRLEPEQFNPRKQFGAEVPWQDYYASKDPVPNGPLFDPDQEATFLRSKEVYNRASLWSDHTTYWLNRDQFVPYVLQDLSSFAHLSLLDVRNGDNERLAIAARRRQWRVRWLAGARLAMWITAGLIVITRMSDLPKWGAAVLNELPVVENFFGWFWGKNLSDEKFAADPWAQRSVGAAFVIAMALASYYVLYAVWQIWTWWDNRALLRRREYGAENLYWVFVLASMALTNAGILVCLGWLGEGMPTEVREGMRWASYLFVPGLFAGIVVFGLMGLVDQIFWLKRWCCRHLRRSKKADIIASKMTKMCASLPYRQHYLRFLAHARKRLRFSMFMESAAAALITAPLTALLLMTGWEESIKVGTLAAIFILACLFLLYGGSLIMPERQGWKRVPGIKR